MSKALQFEKKSATCVVAFAEVPYETTWGEPRKKLVAVRAIKEGKSWRIDSASSTLSFWLPWEALSSEEFPTLAKAKQALRAWARANKAVGK